MKRKILSVIVSLILIIGAVYPALTVASAAWSGSMTTPPISGGFYQISTAEQLAWFANAVNNGTTTIKAVLTADIELNAPGSTENEWTPIGTTEHPFEGTFDGAGHTISGVYVNTTASNVGLFGKISNTADEGKTESVAPEFIVSKKMILIKNLRVTDSDITGHQNVGGIVGNSDGAGIKDCYFEGNVKGTYNSVGAIVGLANAETVVNQCQTTGTVTGEQRTGGVVGYANGNSVVSKCYSNASVAGTRNVGGIVGTLSGGSLVGCFFRGNVTADNRVGGIIGYSTMSVVRGAYAIGGVNSAGADKGGAVGIIFGGEFASIFYCFEMSQCDGPVGIGRTMDELYTADFVKELNKAMPYFCFDYTEINDGFPVLMWMLQSDVWSGELEVPKKNDSGYYLIYKPSELAWFAGLVNGTIPGVNANPSANAEVMDNLLFNINVYDDSMAITEWTPIGTSSKPYTGSFKGGGFNIAGIYTSVNATEDGKNIGFFGYVGSGAQIDNVLIMDGLICGVENVGGIAGYVMGAQVSNCVSNSEVRGDKAVGGVAGNILAGAKITGCGMIGSINATNTTGDQSFVQNIGGVVGYNNRSEVKKSFSYSDINAAIARYVGGVVGNNVGGTIQNCYSTSTITGNTNCGGIVGYYNQGSASKCYTAGKVTASSLSGIAFGQITGTGISECFYDSAYLTISNTISGATAKTTQEMSGTRAINALGLYTSEWRFLNDDEYFYYYPQINTMAYAASRTIKETSKESVRRVQPQYVARVEIDGRTDTYYQTLDAALEYASTTASVVLPTVYLVRDFELSETLEVSSTIGIFGEDGATLKRAAGFNGTMINVTGKLTIGSAVYGFDDSPAFYVDGNFVEGVASAITVQKYGVLTIEDGVQFRNFKTVPLSTTAVRGAVINVKTGSLVVNGGSFYQNVSKSTGGVIYNDSGTVTVTDGNFKSNEATQGAAIYNYDGTLTITGGKFEGNISSLKGGACATYGLYGKTTIANSAEFVGNQSTDGGALSADYYGTINIEGGSFTGNVAYSSGGVVFVNEGATLNMTGGYMANNSSNHSKGGAVYNTGAFTMKGLAQIDSSNDVYLAKDKYIAITDRLDCAGYAAVVTPESYSEGQQVLSGDFVGTGYAKFGVTNSNWYILANGNLTSLASKTIAVVTKENAFSVQFTNLYDAFESVKAGEQAIITVVADNSITKPITVRGDILLTCDEETFVSMRGGAFNGVMFTVENGAVLRLGDEVVNPEQQAQKDYATGTRTEGQMILDGGLGHTGVVGAAAIDVKSGGELHLYDDAIIQNFKNTTSSVVTISGKMYMYGGTICDNISTYGGAVYVKTGGELHTMGGVICNNTATKGGNAVYSDGKVVRTVYSYDYLYMEHVYDADGKYVETKDPVYYSTVSTDIFIKHGDAVYLTNNLMYTAKESKETIITNTNNVPVEDNLSLGTMTLDFAKYTLGSVVLTGAYVSNFCIAFDTAEYGYYILSNGTLGINKLIPKETSGLELNKDKALISGLDLTKMTVGNYLQKFENSSSLIKFYSPKSSRVALKNTDLLTTGCYIQLRDSTDTSKVIDTVTIVVYGDTNCDYAIDGQDSVLIGAIAEGLLTAENTSVAVLEAADINFDGKVNSIDAEHTDMSGLFLQTIGQNKA
ncbi:MAG: hypothetical protein IIX16_10235 [Clostridia bacterium]|nr:hypothetical protein [Clostridia bacterium]